MDDDQDRGARADARRRSATLHRTTLERTERDLDPVRGAEAVSLVDRLTRASWSLAGRAYPTYTRSEIPVRFVLRTGK